MEFPIPFTRILQFRLVPIKWVLVYFCYNILYLLFRSRTLTHSNHHQCSLPHHLVARSICSPPIQAFGRWAAPSASSASAARRSVEAGPKGSGPPGRAAAAEPQPLAAAPGLGVPGTWRRVWGMWGEYMEVLVHRYKYGVEGVRKGGGEGYI